MFVMRQFSKLRIAQFAAFAAVLSCSAIGGAAHAQTNTTPNPYTNNIAVGYGYQHGDVIPNGATSQVVSGGNTLAVNAVATDYGQIANVFMTRFAPVLVVCGIAGATIIASKGGVKMVHGWLRGAFH